MKKILYVVIATCLAACNNPHTTTTSTNNDPVSGAPKPISYSIINTYRHDTSSFTQGLIVYNGNMYEGTGNKGESHLMQVDLKT